MEFDELWNSVSEDRGVDELRRYLRDGGSVNVRHSDSTWTLVHLACEHMNLDLIRTLSEAGADQNARDRNQGWTPLHLAVDTDIDSVWQAENSFSQLTFSTTRLLLALGADPTIRDSVNSYRVLWPCHSRLTPKYRAYLSEVENNKKVYHLRSAKEMSAFLESVQQTASMAYGNAAQ